MSLHPASFLDFAASPFSKGLPTRWHGEAGLLQTYEVGSVQAAFPTCIILSSAHLQRRGLPQSPEKWQDVLRHLLLPLPTFTADSCSMKYLQGVHLMISLFTF